MIDGYEVYVRNLEKALEEARTSSLERRVITLKGCHFEVYITHSKGRSYVKPHGWSVDSLTGVAPIDLMETVVDAWNAAGAGLALQEFIDKAGLR